ncbi:hypothetical protein Nepgr_030463 [Nepenthes gracilis]|uniref:SWIM-type domain-containing protein n=1 Tax=Nepenthes gracilis TaxID=150966 RepID=A0AAD3Y5S5_NEPGR|nr:hypothetical protein Nepgr_030463 [Nepenthes gracilis]
MVGSKRIIAICQSGGEFVTDKDGSLLYTGGEAYAIDIDQNTQLSDFKAEVAEMFNYNDPSMSIKYFLPGNKKTLITISKDKDLNRMVTFLGDANTVDVFIITEECPARNVSNMPVSRSSRTTVSDAVLPPVSDGDAIVENNSVSDHIDMDIASITPLNDIPFGFIESKHQKAAQQWENAITGVDQRFGSFNEFREALHRYSIAHGFAYRYKKNDSHRVTVKCKSDGCRWRIYASRLTTTQLICIKKMIGDHTCGGASLKAGYRATRGWVRSLIKEKLKVSPNYKPKDIADDIRREFGIQLNYSQAWRAKEIAREQLQGSYKEAYSQLPLFCQRIIETNPGSVATFSTKEDSSFHRLFISFHASITGFQQGCRPLLFLDSNPLNSKYQGELLSATAADGNDDVFPLAFAVVDSVSNNNWRWFLKELKMAVSLSQPITFVADFHNGLKELLPEIFSDAHHAYCLRYMAEKLNKDLKGRFSHEARRLMVNDFYAAAYAPKLDEFHCCIDNIKAISPEAYDWVMKSDQKHWANALFGGARYNLMTSHFGQLFYGSVSEANELPITQMIDVLRGKMMELIDTRRMESNQWVTRLTPSKEIHLEKEASKARSLQVFSRGSTFEVHGESSGVVDIDNWDCSCKGWRLTGLPCSHAIAVFECIGRDPYDYCSRYFMVDCYRLTYAELIHPVSSLGNTMQLEANQSPVTVTPPPTKRPPGRPKVKPTESTDVIKRQLQCSKCKGLGHNKKTCKAS